MLMLAVVLAAASSPTWRVSDSTDNVTGERTISSLALATMDYERNPAMYLYCTSNGSVSIGILGTDERPLSNGSEKVPVYLTLIGADSEDERAPEFWKLRGGKLLERDPNQDTDGFVARASNAGTMEFSILTSNGKVIVSFNTDGFGTSYAYMKKNCPFAKTKAL